MAKRDEGNTTAPGTAGASGSTVDSMEQKMLAFAEQLGRIVGTVQAKAEGWLDRDALNAQISTVRDSASALLDQLGGGTSKAAAGSRPASSSRSNAGRSMGRDAGSTKGGAKGKGAAKPKTSSKGKVASKMRASATSGAVNTKNAGMGRSGGAVDAPGKKHRKPMPSESGATGAPRGEGSRIAKLRMANEIRKQQRRG
jgi:hypothetical protein